MKLDSLADVEEQLKDLRTDVSPETYEAFIQKDSFKDIMEQYEIFCAETGLFSHSVSYIDMIMLMLRFIRSTQRFILWFSYYVSDIFCKF